jgi:TolA-binding protein
MPGKIEETLFWYPQAMNLTEEQFDAIERYLGPDQPEAERRQFEARLAQDADLAAEVERQRTLRQTLQTLAARERFRQMHERLEQQGLLGTSEDLDELTPDEEDTPVRPLFDSGESSTPVRELRPYSSPAHQASPFGKYLVAATVAGLALGSVVFYYLTRNDPETTDLYRTFYQPDTATAPLPATLSWEDRAGQPAPNAEYQRTLEQAVQAYRSGRYQQSEALIRRLPERGGSSVFYQDYYLGVSYLETGDTKRALRYLKAASRAPQRDVRQPSEWYLALGYLKDDHPADAARMLRKIIDTPGHPYQRAAQELLPQVRAE